MIRLKETKIVNGQELKCYELINYNGERAEIINYGARIHKLLIKDIKGNLVDVVAGFDDISGYLGENPYFNAVIGRTANRIGKAKFMFNGKEYKLNKNDGENNLHGGNEGFDRKFWTTEIIHEDEREKLLLTYYSADSEENYPSDLSVKVTYELTDESELMIEYYAETSGETVCNLTNHAYFNLSGSFDNTVLNEALRLKSDKITAIDKGLIPNGEYYNIKNTPLDFNSFKALGEEINDKNEFLEICGGYDFNYVLRENYDGYAAKVFDPKSCIEMEVYTTEPCVQLYTANFLDGLKGKIVYNKHSAFCLETQGYPNAVNVPKFKSITLKKGEEYHSKTVYKFSLFN